MNSSDKIFAEVNFFGTQFMQIIIPIIIKENFLITRHSKKQTKKKACLVSVSGDVDTNPGAVKHSFRSALKHTQLREVPKRKKKSQREDMR